MISNLAGSADESFSRFREMLIRNYGEAVYKSWFDDLMLDEAGDDAVTLSTASDLKRDRLDQQFKPALIRVWSETAYPIRRINIVKRAMQAQSARINALAPAGAARLGAIKNGFAPANGHAAAADEARLLRVDEILTPLDPRLTFESFAVGKSNEVAVAAAHQVFNDGAPREILYLFGPSGVGKSHLMQAVGNAWIARHPASRVVYLTHDKIQKGCVGALRSQSTMSFQRDLLSYDLVIIDDIHMLAGKAGTLGELLVLINALVGAGKQIIIAGEAAPAGLAAAGVNERLADRLAGGLAVRVLPADDALRLDVLKKHRDAADLECEITDEALALLARLFSSSMRECVGAFKQLALVYRRQAITVGPNEAIASLKDRLGDRRRQATLEEALFASAQAFGISPEEIRGRAQPQRIVRARHAFVYLARTVLAESFPRIGRALGRDHTTAISSMRRAEALIVRDKAFQEAVAAIKLAIGADFVV
jgi:chromosomal replication initiator protein